MKSKLLFAIGCLLFSGTMFFSDSRLVDGVVLLKWYVFGFGALLLGCVWIWSKRGCIRVDPVFGTILLFVGYLLLRILIAQGVGLGSLILIAFLLVYVVCKTLPVNILFAFFPIILSVCVLQALFGIGQYAGLFHAVAGFPLTGSFDNPAGFAACISAGSPFCFSLLDGSWRNKIFGVLCLIILFVAVVLSGSRAGIFAFIITFCTYLILRYCNIRVHSLKILSGLFAVAVVLIGGLFFLKPDSALGRLLIWKTTLVMIADDPLWGHGSGAFLAKYMEYQADYFDRNPNSKFELLANNISHPFNEFLLLVAEYGLIGLILLLFVVCSICYYQPRVRFPAVCCLLNIAVFACFSYPLRYAFVALLAAVSLACLGRAPRRKLKVALGHWRTFFGCGLIVGGAVILIKDMKFEYTWGRLAQRLVCSEEQLAEYDDLYYRWNGNVFFLYNYGAVLNRAGRYMQSNYVIKRGLDYLNDYDVQLIVGNNYNQLGAPATALRHYELAGRMIPNRLMPLYYSMLLYRAHNEPAKAVAMARKILHKEIKIPSSIVDRIFRDAKEINDCLPADSYR